MSWKVQSEQTTDHTEHEEGPERHTVNGDEFNRLFHSKGGVFGEDANEERENGVCGENNCRKDNGNDWVDDEGTMVLANNFLRIHHVNFVGSNARVEH